MTQASLFDAPAGLPCAFGVHHAVGEPCERCEAETARGIAEFEAGVAAGRWDAQGYTPAERRAQR